MHIIPIICLLTALALLCALSWIDFKTRLLPNKLVLPFALTGFAFHIATSGVHLSFNEMILGGAAGYCLLYSIRFVANKIYKTDSLGLGDVKLMGAGGLWLGFDMLMMALVIGSGVALIHGLIYGLWQARKTGEKLNLSKLQIPAGPGFAVGLILSAGIMLFS